MIAIIQAGGQGTRLKSVTGDLPKPLVPLAGRPAIFRLIDWLKSFSEVRNVIVLAGYKGFLLRDELQMEFDSFVQTIIEDSPLGSGGCLRLAMPFVGEETVLLLGGDLFVKMDLKPFLERHKNLGSNVTLTVHGNNHPFDADLIEPDEEFRFVQKVLLRPHASNLDAYNIVNAAVILINPDFWKSVRGEGFLTFEKDLLLPYMKRNKIGLYFTSDIIQDLGTPDRLQSAEKYIYDQFGSKELDFNFALLDVSHAPDLDSPELVSLVSELSSFQTRGGLLGISHLSGPSASKIKGLETLLGRRGIKISWRQRSFVSAKETILPQIAGDLGITTHRVKWIDSDFKFNNKVF